MIVSPHIQKGRTYGIPHIWLPDDEFGVPGDIVVLPNTGNWLVYPELDAAHDIGSLTYRFRNARFSGDVRAATFSSLASLGLRPASGSYVDVSTEGTSLPRIGGILHVNITSDQSSETTDTLMTYTIPANVLGNDKDFIRVKCWGNAVAGSSKSIFLQIASTTIVTSGSSPHAGDWNIDALISRESATAVRTLGIWDCPDSGGTVPKEVTSTTGMSKDCTTSLALELKCTTTFTFETSVTQHGMIVEWWPGQ